ncbi:MAG: GDP-mannose 4,6-dehydratase [Helicobacter sp.]|nr:GDP-mannose 4,6-dehydratase [Helicobacter sp.]MCH5314015.1 GDP-mannose 4,6-dehydratase [Helicobacter sp.]
MKRALITGITGQDGAYLAEFLIKRCENLSKWHLMS